MFAVCTLGTDRSREAHISSLQLYKFYWGGSILSHYYVGKH